jgi:hypothetical protein
MCNKVNMKEPHKTPNALEWDSMTMAMWLDDHVTSHRARAVLDAAVGGPVGGTAQNTSLLQYLYIAKANGGPLDLTSTEGALEFRIKGGSGLIVEGLAQTGRTRAHQALDAGAQHRAGQRKRTGDDRRRKHVHSGGGRRRDGAGDGGAHSLRHGRRDPVRRARRKRDPQRLDLARYSEAVSGSEPKNLEAISRAIDQHNANCPFPASEVRMNPFEIERLGWEEIRGLPIVGDPELGTGRFRIVCSRDSEGGGIEEVEAVGTPLEVGAPDPSAN